jgi:hypothetical protein
LPPAQQELAVAQQVPREQVSELLEAQLPERQQVRAEAQELHGSPQALPPARELEVSPLPALDATLVADVRWA